MRSSRTAICFLASGERCREATAYRFAFARTDACAQHDIDLPQARNPRFRVSLSICPTDFCQPLLALIRTRALGFRPDDPVPERMGSIGGSVVSRRAGSASTGRTVTRRGIRSRVAVVDAISSIRTCALSRSTHDFVSDISSPLESRFRHCRSACVGLARSRPFPPTLVKGLACHDPRCLPPVFQPFSFEVAPSGCLATLHRLSTLR